MIPTQIARNGARFYRVSTRQMRYFPLKAAEAELMLADGRAVETPYLPFGRPDLYAAYKVAAEAIAKAAGVQA